jgi:hypothetical protein
MKSYKKWLIAEIIFVAIAVLSSFTMQNITINGILALCVVITGIMSVYNALEEDKHG